MLSKSALMFDMEPLEQDTINDAAGRRFNDEDFTPSQIRTLALAAITQAAELVVDIAEKGKADSYYSQALIDSLFVFDPKQSLDVYAQNPEGLKQGLSALSQLSKPIDSKRFNQVTRYCISLIALERQLSKQPDMLGVISSRLKHCQLNQNHFLEDDETAPLRSNISGIYQDTISKLRFRIQVTGNVQLLTQTHHADHIRALLFSGIRAAMLWRQLGGNRWQIIFKRRQIEQDAKAILAKL